MRRLRGIIIGVLLLGGSIFAAEIYLRSHQEVSTQLLSQNDPFVGWTPSQEFYLTPPTSQVIRQYTDLETPINVRYDAQGFRIGQEVPTQPNHLLFMGDQCTLASNVKEEQTFISLWQNKQDQHLQRFSLRSGRFINAAQPQGCPLIWLLQDSARFSQLRTEFVICVVEPQTFENDLLIRRTVTFNHLGHPVSSKHPYALAEKNKQPTQIDNVLQSQLAKLTIPLLRELFLGSNSDKPNSPENKSLRTELINSPDSATSLTLALEPLIELRNRVRERGGQILIVYLPDATELLQLQKRKPKNQPPVILTNQNQQTAKQQTFVFRDAVRKFAVEQQFRLCDTTDFLNREADPEQLFSTDGNRLSLTGHQKVSEVLMDYFSAKTARTEPNKEQK